MRKNDSPVSRQPPSTEAGTKKQRDSGLKEESRGPPATEDVKKEPVACQEERLSIKATERKEPKEVVTPQAAVPCVEKAQSSVDSVKPKAFASAPVPAPAIVPAPAQAQVTSFVPFQGGGHRLGGANVSSASFEDDLPCATAQEPLHSPEHSKPKKSKTDNESKVSCGVTTGECHVNPKPMKSRGPQNNLPSLIGHGL